MWYGFRTWYSGVPLFVLLLTRHQIRVLAAAPLWPLAILHVNIFYIWQNSSGARSCLSWGASVPSPDFALSNLDGGGG